MSYIDKPFVGANSIGTDNQTLKDAVGISLHECPIHISSRADPSVNTVFEGAFESNNVAIRADILNRSEDGWELYEVKSSSSVKPEHIYDLWIQIKVLTGLSIPPSRSSLTYINKDYVFDGNNLDLNSLFRSDDLVEELDQKHGEFEALFQKSCLMLAGDRPVVDCTSKCRSCEFADICISDKPEHWIANLPKISKGKWDKLTELGIEDIRHIPTDFPLTDPQRIVRDATASDTEFISSNLSAALDELKYPIYFLDFETFSPAVPRYVGTRPYHRLPFQWSCHVMDADENLTHMEFLHDNDTDPREALTDGMTSSLGDTGSIIHYTPFETSVLKELKVSLPHHEEALTSIIDRCIDLAKIIRDNYYHPGFKGSYSIKNVLPALVPDMSYDSLEITDGEMASIQYEVTVTEDIGQQGRNRIREALLEYCKQDTMAMVKLFEVLRTKT